MNPQKELLWGLRVSSGTLNGECGSSSWLFSLVWDTPHRLAKAHLQNLSGGLILAEAQPESQRRAEEAGYERFRVRV